jgi:hypothetical protein
MHAICWGVFSGTIALTGWTQSIPFDPSGVPMEASDGEPMMPIPAEPDPRVIGDRILHRALLESVWGEPIFCEVRQDIELFGKRRSGFGKYVRGGKGSGRLRMSLQIPAGDQMNTLLQISDGELLTTFVTVGESMSRTQVDLGKVRDRLTLTVQSLQDPVTAMVLAIGGQAEALRKLCQQYRWTRVTESRLGQQRVWVLEGKASRQPIGLHSDAPVDRRIYEERTGMVPLRALLTVGHSASNHPFWLFKAQEWYQDSSDDRSPLSVATEWDSPTQLSAQQVLPDVFRLPASEHQAAHEIREETRLYLPPASSTVAAEASQSLLSR